MGIKITEINIIGLFLFVLFGMEVFLSISFITALCQPSAFSAARVWMVRRQKKQSLAEQMRAQG